MITQKVNTIVIGIGSPNGDDQLGWQVVDRLVKLEFNSVRFRKVNNPVDILSLIEGCDYVHLVDAAIGMQDNKLLRRLHFADSRDRAIIQEIPGHGTHDLGVCHALRLAESLGQRTDHVALWIGNGLAFEPLSEMTELASQSVEACIEELTRELCDARNVAC